MVFTISFLSTQQQTKLPFTDLLSIPIQWLSQTHHGNAAVYRKRPLDLQLMGKGFLLCCQADSCICKSLAKWSQWSEFKLRYFISKIKTSH
ncbi:hypothetical protein EUGRSUZ_D02076 [Eucalyptus grandis]|uniref:Uncharacterized protein n=2 Tax=Eucalyptus grandis TaxID=71139 RepID=A0ACC3L7H5_EUCGR|nr:hypothetical protein EUGRSUZ_D02076 [Eucalyptus grandis]